MDGYSVSEAASVLGVPIERVWELLARGVLAGAPEGETGMRVFLQPRPGTPPAERTALPPTNGGPGAGAAEAQREPSPFRELLTEFRNLTERYGQALLALGESRGEVAALRSRVDLLEARMDLGLPGGGGASTSMRWPQPSLADARRVTPAAAPTRPVATGAPAAAAAPGAAGAPEVAHAAGAAQPVAATPAPVALDAQADDEADLADHRPARGPRRATESFAEALARAEDPSSSELLELDEPIDAASPLVSEPPPEPALPRELPPAEPMPVAEEPIVAASSPAGPTVSPSVEAVAEAPAAIEPALAVDATPGEEAAPTAQAEQEAEPMAAPAPQVDATLPQADATLPQADATPSPQPVEPSWDVERYTAVVDEPDWYEAEAEEDDTSLTMQTKPAPQPAEPAEPVEPVEPAEPAEPVQPVDAPRVERPIAVTTSGAVPEPGPPGPPTGPEPEPEPEPGALPGSADLGASLAALRATEPAKGAPVPRSVRPVLPPSALRYRPIGSPGGPAGRAYRRLRRIFPD